MQETNKENLIVGEAYYRCVFKNFKYAIHKPKNNQCSTRFKGYHDSRVGKNDELDQGTKDDYVLHRKLPPFLDFFTVL